MLALAGWENCGALFGRFGRGGSRGRRALLLNVVFRDDLPFQRGCGDTKFSSWSANNGPSFEENNPVLCRNVIRMDLDVVTGDLSSKDAHSLNPLFLSRHFPGPL